MVTPEDKQRRELSKRAAWAVFDIALCALILPPLIVIGAMALGFDDWLSGIQIPPFTGYLFPFLIGFHLDTSASSVVREGSAHPVLYTIIQWAGMTLLNVWIVRSTSLKRPLVSAILIAVVWGGLAAIVAQTFRLQFELFRFP
jgi:hypothetical protein